MGTIKYCPFSDLSQADPLDILFGDARGGLLESDFSPMMKADLYRRLMKLLPIQHLPTRDNNYQQGLVSLSALLRRKPGEFDCPCWMKLSVDTRRVANALSDKNIRSNQQFYPLFDLRLPYYWKDLPTEEVAPTGSFKRRYLVPFERVALLVSKGRGNQLFLVKTTWTPDILSLYSERGPGDEGYNFTLTKLRISPIEWNDKELLARIESGEWGDVSSVIEGVKVAGNDAIDSHMGRVRQLRWVLGRIDQVQHGILSAYPTDSTG